MNILFLTLNKIDDINHRGIYTDLLRQFIYHDHKVYIISPIERRFKQNTRLDKYDNYSILKVKTLNIQKTNVIEKGIGTLMLELQYYIAINKFFKNIPFDLILYTTPPITLTNLIVRLKNKFNSKTYLLLKDIFPQNAVDMGMISKSGILYSVFRRTEKRLYRISDFIGCMSPANVSYIIENNTYINSKIVEVCPNSIELISENKNIDKNSIRIKYGIPKDSCIFIYGGNLGKPQGLDFLLEVLKTNYSEKDYFFIIVGSGTEYNKIAKWFKFNKPENAILLKELPREEYDSLVKSCDVGLIFLDPRFTIPNYPSRILSYLENKIPILLATDVNTDIGTIAEKNEYGLWCKNGDLPAFNLNINKLSSDKILRKKMGEKGYNYLKVNYTVKRSFDIIMKHFN